MKEKSSQIQLDKTMELNLQEETKQLKKQLALVTQERDILKKAVAYFAKGTLWSTPGWKYMKKNSQFIGCVAV